METNSFNRRLLSYKDMQEMLPDYAFGRLNSDDAESFEFYLDSYPNLQEELRQVQQVFSRIDKMAIDSKIHQRTRNLSVKVNQRLKYEKAKPYSFSVRKYIMPALGLVAVLAIAIFNPQWLMFNKSNKLKPTVQAENTIVKPADASVLIENIDDLNKIADLSIAMPYSVGTDYLIDNNDNSEIEEMFNTYLATSIAALSSSSVPNSTTPNVLLSNNIITEINTMAEDDFQEILKEIKNVDFNS